MGQSQSKKDKDLIEACQKNDIVSVEILLKKGANVNATIIKTYLSYKVKGTNKLEKIKPYIENSVLSYSIKHRYEEISEVLIKNGADIKLMENYGHNPLIFDAIISGCSKNIIRLLIENGANININVQWWMSSSMFLCNNHNKSTLLGYAIIERLNIAELLLSYNIDVNMKDSNGKTPLKIAIEYARCIPYHVFYNIDSYFPEYEKQLFKQKDFIIKLLISRGAEITDEIFDLMLSKGLDDLCLIAMQKRAFDRRKHLLHSYYSNIIY
jgi:ankyrin repeat protein